MNMPILKNKNTLEAAKAQYMRCKKAYEKGSSELSDAEFDKLEDRIRRMDPGWQELKATGVKIGKKSAAPLAVPMSSLDKLKADLPKPFAAFVRRLSTDYGSAVYVSDKLDGSSVQLLYKKGQLTKMTTRGDGTTGKDISFFIPVLTTVPQQIDTDLPILVLRCEALIPKRVYETKWAGKFDSARAMASSLLNRQDVHPALHDLQFVVLRVLRPLYSVSAGLEWAKQIGFKVANGGKLDLDSCDADTLREALIEKLMVRREKSAYDLDGLVIFSDGNRLPPPDGERPSYARAFKLNDEIDSAPTTRIIGIKWQPSAFGVLVPKAIVEPIKFGNVTVKHAALHNPKWAQERGAGIGATVKVIRSGEIIPKIIDVVKRKAFKLPDATEFGEYAWDKTGTAIVLKDKSTNDAAKARGLARMFGALGLDSLSIGLAKKCVEAGFDTPSKVVKMTAMHFRSLPGVKTSADKYAAEIARIRNNEFHVVQLMIASGCFDKGVGKTNLLKLADAGRQVMTADAPNLDHALEDATLAAGPVFAGLFVKGLPKFVKWRTGLGLKAVLPKKAKAVKNGPLAGHKIAWTGYRDKTEEAMVLALGGEVVNFSPTSTTILVYLPQGKRSSKLDRATEAGIPLLTWIGLQKKYDIFKSIPRKGKALAA